MNKHLTALPFIAVVAIYAIMPSCSNTVETIAENQDTLREPQLIIGDPISYSVDSLTIFPVGLSSYVPYETAKPDVQRGSGNFGIISNGTASVGFTSYSWSNSYASDIRTFTNENTANVDIRNLIFYNRFTGKNYKILTDKLHIIAFSIHNEFKNPIIMYHVVKNDYNKDKKYDYNDPVMLYISDLYGKNLIQLSPDQEQYLDYTFYRETNKILLKVKSDTDTNRVFDSYDQCIFREVNLNEPSMGKVLFGQEMIDDLKKLL